MGVATQRITVNQNMSTKNRTAKYRWKNGSKIVCLDFTQLAHPLGLSIASLTTTAVILSSTADGADAFDPSESLVENPDNIKVWRNGVALTKDTDFSYSYNTSHGYIYFTSPVASGDVIKIYIKSGDAAAETVTQMVP